MDGETDRNGAGITQERQVCREERKDERMKEG